MNDASNANTKRLARLTIAAESDISVMVMNLGGVRQNAADEGKCSQMLRLRHNRVFELKMRVVKIGEIWLGCQSDRFFPGSDTLVRTRLSRQPCFCSLKPHFTTSTRKINHVCH